MAYATLEQLIARCGESELIQLTDPANQAIDESVVAVAQEHSCALIDGYLATRYRVPVVDCADPALARMDCSFTRYYLWKEERSKAVQGDYDADLAILRDYQSGRAVLLGAARPDVGTPGDDLILMQSAGSMFSRDSGGFL